MYFIDDNNFIEFKEWCLTNFSDKFTISINSDVFNELSQKFYNINEFLSNCNKYDIFIIYCFFTMVKETTISLYILTYIKNKYKEVLDFFKEFK
jgi:hypothetical protein